MSAPVNGTGATPTTTQQPSQGNSETDGKVQVVVLPIVVSSIVFSPGNSDRVVNLTSAPLTSQLQEVLSKYGPCC